VAEHFALAMREGGLLKPPAEPPRNGGLTGGHGNDRRCERAVVLRVEDDPAGAGV